MNLRHSILLVTVAFGAGALFTLWKRNELPLISPTTQAELPEQAPSTAELKSNAFALRALHAALECTEGNVLLAPHALAENLRNLQQISRGATQAELNTLPLGTEQQTAAEAAGEVAVLFSDSAMAIHNTAPLDSTIPVPLGGKAGEPIQLLNSILNEATSEVHTHFISSEHLQADARLISFCALSLRPTWKQPVLAAKTENADFFNATGGMPQIRTVQTKGAFCLAKAPDDAWQAIAIPLQLSSASAKDECLLLIAPREHSARQFAKKLTQEQLTDIQKAVANAEPTSVCVEFPRLSFAPPTQDLLPLLQALGLKNTLSPQADLSGLAADKPLFLNAALQKCRIPLIENKPDTPQDLPDVRFDKPFIWMIGSLRSPAPPYAMGIVENL